MEGLGIIFRCVDFIFFGFLSFLLVFEVRESNLLLFGGEGGMWVREVGLI